MCNCPDKAVFASQTSEKEARKGPLKARRRYQIFTKYPTVIRVHKAIHADITIYFEQAINQNHESTIVFE